MISSCWHPCTVTPSGSDGNTCGLKYQFRYSNWQKEIALFYARCFLTQQIVCPTPFRHSSNRLIFEGRVITTIFVTNGVGPNPCYWMFAELDKFNKCPPRAGLILDRLKCVWFIICWSAQVLFFFCSFWLRLTSKIANGSDCSRYIIEKLLWDSFTSEIQTNLLIGILGVYHTLMIKYKTSSAFTDLGKWLSSFLIQRDFRYVLNTSLIFPCFIPSQGLVTDLSFVLTLLVPSRVGDTTVLTLLIESRIQDSPMIHQLPLWKRFFHLNPKLILPWYPSFIPYFWYPLLVDQLLGLLMKVSQFCMH